MKMNGKQYLICPMCYQAMTDKEVSLAKWSSKRKQIEELLELSTIHSAA